GPLVERDRLRAAVLLDEQAAEGEQHLGITGSERGQLALDRDRARPVAHAPVERDQALAHRLVAGLRLAAALEQGELLLARAAARRGQQAVAGLEIPRRQAAHALPVLDRGGTLPERVVALGEPASALGV